MQYSRRRNAFLSGSTWPVAAGLGILVLLFFIFRTFAPDVLTAIATPFWQTGDQFSKSAAAVTLPFQNTSEIIAERDQLLIENETLRNQNAVLTAQVGDKGALGNGLSAGVLARPPVSPYDSLVLGLGGTDGVRVDAMIYAPGGIPIGVIENVTSNTSRAILFTAPGRVTEGWVGDTRIPVSLVGKGAGAFEASLPREAGATVGAVVYAPGPGALPVGTVLSIDADPSSPRSTLHIKPMVNIFSVTWVTVGL
ncbi:hypothetical protein KKH15_00420 [Patescibacteria group bacterium]|nr:hypothetical protein [Patescibacteria group bacterium]MBU1754994.1 hypothetical protein [Patescibacteria group bacterium]